MKRHFIILLTLFLLGCTTHKNLGTSIKNAEITKIPILIDQEAKEAGAIVFYVPVKIDGIEKEFKMQFDLGMAVSVIYENSLNSILKKYPNLKRKLFERNDYQIFKTNFTFADVNSSLDSLVVYKNYGSDKKFQGQDNIGSIGVNQFNNRILLINYKDLYLQIIENENQIPKEKFDFTPMDVTSNKKIIVKLKAGKDYVNFLFDTGNGVPIATINKEFYDLQTENQKELKDTISGNSWGDIICLYGAKQQKSIGMENTTLSIGDNRLYYTQANRIVEIFKKINIEHSIGNTLFLDKTIVFDFKNNQFGIMKN